MRAIAILVVLAAMVVAPPARADQVDHVAAGVALTDGHTGWLLGADLANDWRFGPAILGARLDAECVGNDGLRGCALSPYGGYVGLRGDRLRATLGVGLGFLGMRPLHGDDVSIGGEAYAAFTVDALLPDERIVTVELRATRRGFAGPVESETMWSMSLRWGGTSVERRKPAAVRAAIAR